MTTSISPVRAGLTIVKFLFLFSPSVICVHVRLIGSTVPGAGRLEVYYRGEWGTVCDDSWDDGDAWTVCRSLGWSDGKAFGSATFGRGSGRIWLDDVQCSFFNTDLEQCSHSGWGSHNCNHGEDAGVWCVRDGDVILTGKTSTPHSGRVEVYHSGEFGTVCDDLFDNKDADVICKMLGYTSGGVAHGNAKYGQGAGRIWLDDLTCSESATRLDQCGLLNWGTHNCGHGEDAGVFCYRGFWETAPCSVTCGIGTQLRFLTCQGFGCVPKSETATCFLMACSVDGQWGSWSSWTSCTVTCGSGTRARSRQCNNPAPAHNGLSCPGDGHESEECTAGITCPVDGQWAHWNGWTSCSVSCEDGTRTRSRQCDNPAPAHNGRFCPGDEQESEGCTAGIMCPIDGAWGLWTSWVSCSASCGYGSRTRSRQCNNPAPAHNGHSCIGDGQESEECTTGIICPIDGQWGLWTEWTVCSVSCENGIRTRSRQCNNPSPAHNGLSCPGDGHESEECTTGITCPVDGQWAHWNGWTSCSVSCEDGTRTRSRQCDNPAPAHNGRFCPGDEQESEGCTAGIMCPIDGAWGLWTSWVSCSASCGYGSRTRSRQCNNPAPAHNGHSCIGDGQESEECTTGIICPIDGQWGLWTEWTVCSVSCENGTRTRSRQCNNPAPAHNGRLCPGDKQTSEDCTVGITCPIDGQWGSWNTWTSCSVSCENGIRIRYRQCNNPAPAHNGLSCWGDNSNEEECSSGIMCPIDGHWGQWNGWTPCSVSCENGTRTRSRQCDNPVPVHNGRPCSGEVHDSEECDAGIVFDGQWTAWNSWSPCSVSCEDGTRTRSRQCLDPAPAHGGLYCPGDQHDTERCSSGIMCPVDGQWGSWLSWTSCSVSCENGTRTRSRQCNNPAPAYNGHYCSGDDHDYEGCTAEIMCPIDGQWSEWNGWSLCSVTCEHGSRTRSRQCNNPAPAHNGLSCQGVVNDEEKCSAGIMCPIDGQWGKWNSWSSCSVTCECGEKMRSRDCDNPNPAHGGMECTGNMSETASCGIDILCPGGCGKDHLMCTDKKTCIHVSMSCDSVKQCPDGSDEINCIGRNLLYMPQFQYLFSSDSTRMCPCLPWLIITWLFLAVFQ